MMKRHGKTNMMAVGVVSLAVVMLALVGWMAYSQASGTGGILGGEQVPSTVYTTETVATKIEYYNSLNDTASDGVDITTICVPTSGPGEPVAITDTTAPTASNLVKGTTYACKLVSSGNSDGAQGKIISLRACAGGSMLPDGSGFTITPTFGSAYCSANVHDQGAFQVRVKNVDEDAWACAATSHCGVWNSTDGATFGDTTDGTAEAMVSGDELNVIYYLRATNVFENVNDLGVWVLVDAATTVWDGPSVTIDGVSYTNQKSQMNEDEAKAYSNYEYAFLVPQDRIIDSKVAGALEIQLGFEAIANPGAGDDISVDFSPRGSYRSTMDSYDVLAGGVTDADPGVQIHTLFDTVLDVS